MQTRTLIALFAALVIAAPALAAPIDMTTGRLRFTFKPSHTARLTVDGVALIREMHLYMVKPGWTGHLLNADNTPPILKQWAEGNVQLATADYETDDASASYRFELHPDGTFKQTLTYAGKGNPCEMEWTSAYLNANLIEGTDFKAETVEGPKSGVVPLFATSEDQAKSALCPPVKSIAFDTVLGPLSITVEGSAPENGALRLFDARGGQQDWAQKNPVFWFGLGVPQIPVTGESTVSVTWKLGPAKPVAQRGKMGGTPTFAELIEAKVPFTSDLPLIPRPKESKLGDARSYLTPGAKIIIPDDALEAEKSAARELQAELRNFYGVRLEIIRADTLVSAGRCCLEGDTMLLLARVDEPSTASLGGCVLTNVPSRPEGYSLKIEGPHVVVRGRDGRGVYNGAQTLKQLIGADAKGVYLRDASVRDWPSLGFRGVHWFGGPDGLPFHRKMISRIVAPLKMNAMVYQVDFAWWTTMEAAWDKNRGMSLDDVKKTVDTARAHLLEPIPLVNGLGHSDWMFVNGANLDVATDPARRYQYDPENPRSYEILFPVMEEAIRIFQPEYFHIGRDEITTGGLFPPKGSKRDATGLILEDINKVCAWLKERNLQPMMWGDEFLKYPEEASDAGNAPSLEESAKRRAGLPKDVIITDWHYQGTNPEFASVAVWQKDGFQVVGTSWNDWGNIQKFAKVLADKKAMGMLQSTWAGWSMSVPLVSTGAYSQFVAYLLAAEEAWNGGVPVKSLGYNPDDAFRQMWDRKPLDRNVYPGFTVDHSAGNAAWWSWMPRTTGGTGPTGTLANGGVTFTVGDPLMLNGRLTPGLTQSVSLPMGNRIARELHFLWGATHIAADGDLVATLRVTYADGTAEEVPLTYGTQFYAFTDTRGGAAVTTAWRGKTPDERAAAVRRWAWVNQRPDQPIASVTLTSANGETSPVLLGVTGVGEAG